MATYGTDIDRIFDEKVYMRYGVYLDNVEKNDLLQEALVQSIENKYDALSEQKEFDDLNSVIKLNQIFELNNNKIYTTSIPIKNIQIGNPTTIITAIPHNLVTGDKVFFTEVQGTISAVIINIFFTVTVTSPTEFTIPLNSTTFVYISPSGHISQHQSSNSIPKLIYNYNHLLSVKAKYTQTLNLKVTDVSNTQPIRIKVDKRNNIKTSELLSLSGVVGNTNANGTFYVKKVNTYQFDLFQDKDFLIPTTGNGDYQGTGVVSRIYYKNARALFSDQKISIYENASVQSPKVERGEQMLQIAPYDSKCYEITIDYISDLLQNINVLDSVINLEDYYHIDFVYFVLNYAVNLYAQRVKDVELFQSSAIELQKEK